MIQGNTAVRTEEDRQTAPTYSPDFYTVRCKNVNGTTTCSFAPITGLDGLVGSQLYQLVELNPLLSLPIVPERIFPDDKYLKARIAVLKLKTEDQHVLPGLSMGMVPKTEVGKLSNPALRAMVNDGELVHLRHPIPFLHEYICKEMQLCDPPISVARYELCWEVEGQAKIRETEHGA